MGLFDKARKTHSPEVDELLDLPDKEIDKILRRTKGVPFKTAAELRKAAKDDERKLTGAKGFTALRESAGLLRKAAKGNYRNVPLKDRVHPSEYKRILDREARKRGLI